MSLTVIFISLITFAIVSAILVYSNRNKPDLTKESFLKFAAATQGKFFKRPLGFADGVKFVSSGYRFEISSWNELYPDQIAGFRHFMLKGKYKILSPFELQLEPRNMKKFSITIKTIGGPVVNTGIAPIEKEFVVRTTNQDITRYLLDDPQVINSIMSSKMATSNLYIGPQHNFLGFADNSYGSFIFHEEDEKQSFDRLREIEEIAVLLLNKLEEKKIVVRTQDSG